MGVWVCGIGLGGNALKRRVGFGRMCRVDQNHIYTVYIQYFWQGNHQIYGHIWCIYTVVANPTYVCEELVEKEDGSGLEDWLEEGRKRCGVWVFGGGKEEGREERNGSGWGVFWGRGIWGE